MENRNHEIDLAKGILIIFVVFGHVLLFTGAYPGLLKIIYSFHMFSFLCISGILWNKEKYKNSNFFCFWNHKLKGILIYYLIFEIIAVTIKNIFPWGEPESINTIILNIIIGNTYLGADWYLYTYFFSCILLFFLFKAEKPIYFFAVLVVLEVFLLYSIGFTESLLVIKFSRILLFSIIVFLSNVYRNKLSKDLSFAHLTVVLIVFFASALANVTVFTHASILGNPLLFFLSGYSGTILILNLSKRVYSLALSECGKRSIVIMGFHQNIEYLVDYFFGASKNLPFILGTFLLMLIISYILYLPIQFVHSLICTGCMTGTELKRRS